MTWNSRPLDPSYLVDSGLLFEINRTILHLFGIALTARGGELGLKDCREHPEQLLFDKVGLENGARKLRAFWAEYGHAQDERRCAALGYGCQHLPRV